MADKKEKSRSEAAKGVPGSRKEPAAKTQIPDTQNPPQGDSRPAKVEVSEVAMSFSGPLPPPQILGLYGDVDSNLPNRMVAMVEKEQAGRLYRGKHKLWNDTLKISGSIFLSSLFGVGAVVSAGVFKQVVVAIFFILSGAIIEAIRRFSRQNKEDKPSR